MDLHKQRLASVCSICGASVAKDVLENPRSVHAVNFSEAIIMISGVIALLDSTNMHPPYMCYCYCYYCSLRGRRTKGREGVVECDLVGFMNICTLYRRISHVLFSNERKHIWLFSLCTTPHTNNSQ